MKKLVALLCAACCALLSGCGGIYSDYTEVEQLLIIQAMGFDRNGSEVTLSASSGSGGMGGQREASQETLRMKASADTFLAAEQLIQDYSASEELFFAHTSYIVLGEEALSCGVAPYLDYIERNDDFRLDVPLFAVLGGTAEEIIIGAGNENYDAVNILSSVERNVSARGDAYIYNAGEIAANLNSNSSAIICAVRSADAASVMPDASEGETTAIFDGYAVIRDKKLVGSISADDALAVNLLLNRSGPALISLTVDGQTAALRLSGSSCTISPVCNDSGEITGLDVNLKVKGAMREYRGSADAKALNSAFREIIFSKADSVLGTSKKLGCDFLQLGSMLQRSDPFAMRCTAEEFQARLPELYIYINVETEIDRGFVIDRR